ncbi:uncharacterized protein LOC130992883 [Salvia miltiorrhiza]|uniref:uncharacterized protein LOC130992883 n=1 Tax=Salvia miltiorrhiza TaxID=226208 RepID=UPI0025ACDD2D|nr:uncharacterized protein LOC130992883 [Salvia miltiorrhiza]
MLTQVHPDDQAIVRKASGKVLAESLSRAYMTEEAQKAEALHRVELFDEVEGNLHEAKSALALKEKEASQAASRLSEAEAELARAQTRLVELEVENNSLESALQEAKRETHELGYRFKERYSKEYDESKRRWREAHIRAHREGYIFGICDQQLEFFLSPQGHQFLKILFEGTVDAFCKTPDFLRRFLPSMAYIIMEIGRKRVKMSRATTEQVAKLDLRALMRSLDNKALCVKLGIDPKAPASPEWWYPARDCAFQQFTVGLCSEDVPTEPIFSSPFLEILQEFLQDLSGDRAAPRSFAEFGLYPPKPLLSDLASLPASRKEVPQELAKLYKDEANFTHSLVGDLSKDPNPFPNVDASRSSPIFNEGPFSASSGLGPSGSAPSSSASPSVSFPIRDCPFSLDRLESICIFISRDHVSTYPF